MRISDWSSDVCSSDLLDHRFGRKDILATVVRTGKCGVSFRVIEEGVAQAATEMRLVERRYPEWTITRLFHLFIVVCPRIYMSAFLYFSYFPFLYLLIFLFVLCFFFFFFLFFFLFFY